MQWNNRCSKIIEQMKKLMNNWIGFRGLRLLLGIILLVQAIMFREMIYGFLAFFLLLTAITNTGCCAGGTCPTNGQGNSKTKIQIDEALDKEK